MWGVGQPRRPGLEPGPSCRCRSDAGTSLLLWHRDPKSRESIPAPGFPGPRPWLLAPPCLWGLCLLRNLSSHSPAAPGVAPQRPCHSAGHRCPEATAEIPEPSCLQGTGPTLRKDPQDRQTQRGIRWRVTARRPSTPPAGLPAEKEPSRPPSLSFSLKPMSRPPEKPQDQALLRARYPLPHVCLWSEI